MSYGHCIVLPNQNRDMVQTISVQDKEAVKEYKAWETTWHNRYVYACFFNRFALINSFVDFNSNCVHS